MKQVDVGNEQIEEENEIDRHRDTETNNHRKINEFIVQFDFFFLLLFIFKQLILCAHI